MLDNIDLEKVLVLDIETVPAYAHYDSMPESWQKLWNRKSSTLSASKEGQTPSQVYNRAGIYAEF